MDVRSADIVSATPEGLELQGFATALLPDSSDQITWQIGGLGFDMNLSGQVPTTIAAGLLSRPSAMLDGQKREDIVQRGSSNAIVYGPSFMGLLVILIMRRCSFYHFFQHAMAAPIENSAYEPASSHDKGGVPVWHRGCCLVVPGTT